MAIECHYLLRVPDEADHRTLLVIALHGYGQNAQTMLRLTSVMMGARHVLASIQAPNQYYVRQDAANPEIGYNWGTRAHWEESVRLHHQMVLQVSREAGARFGIGPERTLLMGFSQPVGLNYRFIGTHPDAVRAVLGICGGVPKDWEEEGKYRQTPAALLHISRDEDEFFPPAVANTFPVRLRIHAPDVEYHLLPGGHRFPSKAGGIVETWLDRVFYTSRLTT